MFKGKEGAIHVDWIISMGIFLIAVMVMMIFLKPGIVPLTEEKIALDILEVRFNENFMWTVKTMPFFVEKCTNQSGARSGSGLDHSIERVIKDFNVQKDSGLGSITGLQVFESDGVVGIPTIPKQCNDGIDNDGDGAVDFPEDFSCSNVNDDDEENPKAKCQDGIDNDKDELIDFPEDPGCSSNQDNDESNPPVGSDRTIINVTLENNWTFTKFRYSDDDNEWGSFLDNRFNIEFICVDDEDENDDSNMLFHIVKTDSAKFLFTYNNNKSLPDKSLIGYECYSNDCNEFIARFGTEENIRGINIDKLSKLTNLDSYWGDIDQIKEDWGFPELNNFWIQGWEESDVNCGALDSENCEYIVNYKTGVSSEVDDIKVKEVKTFILDKYGNLESVRLFFRTW
ncbi:MAG: hypothetical protein AABX08_01840 [Nanoarchaeota archaeon]